MPTINKKLLKQGGREIYEDLATTFKKAGASLSRKEAKALLKQANSLLVHRLTEVEEMGAEFEERLSRAEVTAHLDSLRDGHERQMRGFLRAAPGGIEKETAKQIIRELLRRT